MRVQERDDPASHSVLMRAKNDVDAPQLTTMAKSKNQLPRAGRRLTKTAGFEIVQFHMEVARHGRRKRALLFRRGPMTPQPITR
jgi:hypothetical protein